MLGTSPCPAVAHAQRRENRNPYTIVWAVSHMYGSQSRLPGHLHRGALVMLETTPAVIEWRRVDISLPFSMDGRQMHAQLPFAALRINGEREFWQIAGYAEDRVLANAERAGSRYAHERGWAHVLVSERDLRRRAQEMRNRMAGHKLLFAAREWDTLDHEARLLVLLRRGRLLVSEVQLHLGLTAIRTRVVLLRAWLKELICWPFASIPLMADFVVEVSHGG